MKVILDTDPGIDDALAFILLKALPEISLQAITVTHGNTTVEKCTTNALKLVELLGMRDVPVAMGATEPLVKTQRKYGLYNFKSRINKTSIFLANKTKKLIKLPNNN
jgi:inosine-uridine nucleoside N-ribohydrolase